MWRAWRVAVVVVVVVCLASGPGCKGWQGNKDASLAGGVGDLRFDKFFCHEGAPCEANPGRQMSWFTINARLAANSMRGHTATATRFGVLVVGGLVDRMCSNRMFIVDPRVNAMQPYLFEGHFPARHSHVAAPSADQRTVYIHGGHCRGIHFSDVLALNLESREIRTLETSGELPPISEGARGGVVGDSLLVFGGCQYTREWTCFNGVHTLNLETSVWLKRSTTGPLPPASEGQDAVVLGNKFFVFDMNKNLHALDTSVWVWRRVATQGTVPPAVGGASMVVVASSVLVFGGCQQTNLVEQEIEAERAQAAQRVQLSPDEPQVPPDWELNSLARTVPAPPPLTANDESQPVSFLEETPPVVQDATPVRPGAGVRVRLPRQNSLCNGKLFQLDTQSMVWSVVRTTGSQPAPREAHAAAVVEGKMYMVGGCQQKKCVADIYMLDTELHCVDDCNHHGRCEDGVCHCHPTFGGLVCEHDLRCAKNCSKHGVCVNAVCQCEQGFAGPQCDHDIRCPEGCSQHGSCKQGKCECETPFHGDACQWETDCPSDCSSHGTCHFGLCYCEYGFDGKDCSVEREDVEPLQPHASTTTSTNENGTRVGFLFVGENQVCGGRFAKSARGGSVHDCKRSCHEMGTCGYLTFHPGTTLCQLYLPDQCREMWSSRGTQVFQIDPMPAQPTPEQSPSPSLVLEVDERGRSARRQVAHGQQPPPQQQHESGWALYIYLVGGLALGLLLGLMCR